MLQRRRNPILEWSGASSRLQTRRLRSRRNALVATTAGMRADDIQNLMIERIEYRLGPVDQRPRPIQWLADNGSPYIANQTRAFAEITWLYRLRGPFTDYNRIHPHKGPMLSPEEFRQQQSQTGYRLDPCVRLRCAAKTITIKSGYKSSRVACDALPHLQPYQRPPRLAER